jgi:hypothetical protein
MTGHSYGTDRKNRARHQPAYDERPPSSSFVMTVVAASPSRWGLVMSNLSPRLLMELLDKTVGIMSFPFVWF